MNTLYKTKKGTIGAFRWNNGITFGFYGKEACASLEYDTRTDELVLLLVDKRFDEQGIRIKHVSEEDFANY